MSRKSCVALLLSDAASRSARTRSGSETPHAGPCGRRAAERRIRWIQRPHRGRRVVRGGVGISRRVGVGRAAVPGASRPWFQDSSRRSPVLRERNLSHPATVYTRMRTAGSATATQIAGNSAYERPHPRNGVITDLPCERGAEHGVCAKSRTARSILPRACSIASAERLLRPSRTGFHACSTAMQTQAG